MEQCKTSKNGSRRLHRKGAGCSHASRHRRVLQIIVGLSAAVFGACSTYSVYPASKVVDPRDKEDGFLDEQLQRAACPHSAKRMDVPDGAEPVYRWYKSDDRIDTVEAWYRSELAGWDREVLPAKGQCSKGFRFTNPSGCGSAQRPCEADYLLLDDSWTKQTQIIFWAPCPAMSRFFAPSCQGATEKKPTEGGWTVQ